MNKKRRLFTINLIILILLLTSCEIVQHPREHKPNPGFEGFDQNISNQLPSTVLPPIAIQNDFLNSNIVSLPTPPINSITPPSPTNRELIIEIPPTGYETSTDNNSLTHTVKKNENFWTIAKYYKVNYKDLMVANGVNQKTILHIGTKIIIPNGSGKVIPLKSLPTRGNNKKYALLPADGKYTVVADDNLWVIARKFGVTVDDIKRWNNLSTNTIYPKMVLKLKNRSTPVIKTRVAPPIKNIQTKPKPSSSINITSQKYEFFDHSVEKTDTLTELANIYGSTPKLIKQYNKISNDSDLHKKKIIRIPYPKQ